MITGSKPTSTSSLEVTVRVYQLVHSCCLQIKRRRQQRRVLHQELEFEDRAFERFEKGISRRGTAKDVSVDAYDSIGSAELHHALDGGAACSIDCDDQNPRSCCLQRVATPSRDANVDQLSRSVAKLGLHTERHGPSLQNIAADDSLLLAHCPDRSLRNLTSPSLFQILAFTNDVLDSLYRVASTAKLHDPSLCLKNHRPQKFLDEKFIANLEHLLLRLQGALILLIFRKSLAIVIAHERRSLSQKSLGPADWFFEWPNGLRPLHTAWPWNIRPSLVVLWGVCWQFYRTPGTADCRAQRVVGHGPINADSHALGLPTQSMPLNPSVWNSFSQVDPIANIATQIPTLDYNGGECAPSGHVRSRLALPVWSGAATRPNFEYPYVDGLGDYAADAAFAACNGRHQQPFGGEATTSYNDVPTLPVPGSNLDASVWRLDFCHQQPFIQQDSLGSLLQERANSSLERVITPLLRDLPPGFSVDANNIIAEASDSCTDLLRPFYVDNTSCKDMADTAAGSFPTPNSEASYASTLSDHRSPCPTPSQISPNDISPLDQTARAPTGGAAEPLQDQNGKYICRWSEKCAGLTFNRRCEWTKHRDKHSRPYVCREPQCDKLLGFTYSGGLLRHQREVHRKHGNPRENFPCPYPDCRRSSGAGFSRKENLNEHVRRLHRPREARAGLHGGVVADVDAVGFAGRKRKRSSETAFAASSSTVGSPVGGVVGVVEVKSEADDGPVADELREQNKRLKRQVADKDARVARLESMVRSLRSLIPSHLEVPPGALESVL